MLKALLNHKPTKCAVCMCHIEWRYIEEMCGRLSVKVEGNGWEVSASEETSRGQTEWVCFIVVTLFLFVKVLFIYIICFYAYIICHCWYLVLRFLSSVQSLQCNNLCYFALLLCRFVDYGQKILSNTGIIIQSFYLSVILTHLCVLSEPWNMLNFLVLGSFFIENLWYSYRVMHLATGAEAWPVSDGYFKFKLIHRSMSSLCWLGTIQPQWAMAWFLGVGYSGQPVTCDWPYNLATWFPASH